MTRPNVGILADQGPIKIVGSHLESVEAAFGVGWTQLAQGVGIENLIAQPTGSRGGQTAVDISNQFSSGNANIDLRLIYAQGAPTSVWDHVNYPNTPIQTSFLASYTYNCSAGACNVETTSSFRPVLVETSNYSVQSGDSGKWITNSGATGAETMTLPICNATTNIGANYYFAVDTAQPIQITTASGNSAKVRMGALLTGVTPTLSSSLSGATISFQCIGASSADAHNEWILTGMQPIGSWNLTVPINVSKTAQAASITAANIFTSTEVAVPSLWRIDYYLNQDPATCSTSNGSVTLTFSWTDLGLTRTTANIMLPLNTVQGIGNFVSGSFSIYTSGTSNLTYTAAYVACGTGGKYDLYISLPRFNEQARFESPLKKQTLRQCRTLSFHHEVNAG